jgi:hypothetical protein
MYDYPQAPLYNPMISPYMQQPQQQPRREVVRVNGENGARAFPMGANSSALLLDESGVIVWLVTTDGAGYKTTAPFDITPHKAAPAPDFGSLEQRITRLEERLNAATSNFANAERGAAASGTRTDQANREPAKKPQQSAVSVATDDATKKSSYDASDGVYTAAWQ